MNKNERIKQGFTGKRQVINPVTKERITINYDDTENCIVFSPEEWKKLDELLEKSRKPGFTGYTQEELKFFSEIGGEEEDD